MDALSLLLLLSSSKRSLDISDQPPAVENKNDNNGNTTATKNDGIADGEEIRNGWVAYRDNKVLLLYSGDGGDSVGSTRGGGWSMMMVAILQGTMHHPLEERGGGDGSTDIIRTPPADAIDDERSNVAADGGRGCALALAGTKTVEMATVMAIVEV